jgi:hypothetical protein
MNGTLIHEEQLKVLKNSVRIIEENNELINILFKKPLSNIDKIKKIEKTNKELTENILLIIKKL